MNLQSRLFIFFLAVALLVLVLIGGVLPASLSRQNLDVISEDTITQLDHIDIALSQFVGEIKNDVTALSLDRDIRIRNDTGFTTFLNASEETFRYSIGDREALIIAHLKDYQLTHPFVNSVYMGRENGAFVRAFKRARPTAYDPRERSWYLLAKAHPGEVMVTEPYAALTTADVNIGVVTALIDENDTFYGTVGVDVTLASLTRYLSEFDIGRGGEMVLVDEDGMILASKNQARLFGNISDLLGDRTREFMTTREGVLPLGETYLMYRASDELGWKIGAFVPVEAIDQEINKTVVGILLYVLLALILLSGLSLLLVNHTVIRPLVNLTEVSRTITQTGNLDQAIETRSRGEIGSLYRSFKAMVERIRREEEGRKQALAALADHRDHLEEIVIDRTRELAEAKEAAESADRLKSAFLATMSHELRTPLNSIIGFSGILLQGLAGPLNPEQKKQLGMVAESSEHLLALINDVLDLSKIEAGQLSLADDVFDPGAVIERVARSVGPLAAKKHLALEVDVAPGMGSFRGDGRRVEQILLNLVGNAVKFTEQGTVRVAGAAGADGIELVVSDTGIGIGREDMEKLFRPFCQVETGLNRTYEGTGLGLSISSRLVELMGGTIGVESERGRGSTFRVLLPLGKVGS